jgi:hypothetical protein
VFVGIVRDGSTGSSITIAGLTSGAQAADISTRPVTSAARTAAATTDMLSRHSTMRREVRIIRLSSG